MLRVFFKKHDFDPDMLIGVILIKKERVTPKQPDASFAYTTAACFSIAV